MRRISTVLTLAALGALLAACGGDDDTNTPSASPTSADSAAPTTASAPTATPDGDADEPTATTVSDVTPTAGGSGALTPTAGGNVATATSGTGAAPTATAAVSGPPLTGESTYDDRSGDVEDDDGVLAETPLPAIDLSRVTLSGDGTALDVTFELHEPLPAELDPEGVYNYFVEIIVPDKPTGGYTLTIVHSGFTGWSAMLNDHATFDEVTTQEPPTIAGNTLAASFPADLLSGIEGPFTWYAQAEYADLQAVEFLNDPVPNGAGFGPEPGAPIFLPFPQ
jgi:hypothetical protein